MAEVSKVRLGAKKKSREAQDAEQKGSAALVGVAALALVVLQGEWLPMASPVPLIYLASS